MDPDVLELRLFIVIALLVVILVASYSCSRSELNDLKQQHEEELESVKEHYYEIYEDIRGDYSYIYYEYMDDPGRTFPMDNFTDPDDLRFPIKDYTP